MYPIATFWDHFIVFQLRNRRGIRNLEPQLAAMPLMQQLPGDRSSLPSKGQKQRNTAMLRCWYFGEKQKKTYFGKRWFHLHSHFNFIVAYCLFVQVPQGVAPASFVAACADVFASLCAILYSIFEIFWVLPGKMIGFQSVTMCKTHSFARNQPTDPASVAWLPQGPERVAQCWPTSTNPCDWSRPVGDPKRTNPVQQTAQWDAISHYSTKPNAKHQTRQKPGVI